MERQGNFWTLQVVKKQQHTQTVGTPLAIVEQETVTAFCCYGSLVAFLLY